MESKLVNVLIYFILICILLCVKVTIVRATMSSAKSTNTSLKDDSQLNSQANQIYLKRITNSKSQIGETDDAEHSRMKTSVNIFDLGKRKESKRFNIFNGLWNRVRSSPLYLVNGTVCRSVNGSPICTTLATTGLLPSTGGGSASSSARPPTQGVQSSGSSVQLADVNSSTNVVNSQTQNPVRSVFQNQEANQERPRPAVSATSAILQDDSQDINVASVKNANSTSPVDIVRQVQLLQTVKPQALIQTTRPLTMQLAGRRPLNLMALRKPASFLHQTI